MQSNDNYVTVEMFNNGIQEIKNEIRFTNLRIDNMAERIDGVHGSINTGFTTIGIIIGLVGLIIAVFGVFKKEKPEIKTEQRNSPTFEEVNNIVETAISRALAGISR